MKEIQLNLTICDFTAQDYYNAIYEGPDAFTQYHQVESNDPTAKVSAWESGSRAVHFNLALNVPQMFKKMIGADSISVVENQEIKWHGKDKFVVSSVPSLDFPGSSKFTTKGHTTVYTVDGNTCQVDTTIICNAVMPWPMQGTVEAAMASEAQAGIGKFLDYCKRRCEAARAPAPAAIAPATPLPATPPTVEMEGTTEEGEDFYYDAWETLEQQPGTSGTGASARRAQPGMQVGRPVSTSGTSYEPLLLAALRELQVSSQATAQALADVAGHLKAMNDNVAAIRTAVSGAPSGAWQAGRGSWGGSYGVMLMVAAGASAACVVYVRSRQRTGQ